MPLNPKESPPKFRAFSIVWLARERALADQNTDVIDAHCAEGTSLCGGRNFVDLNDHAAS